MGLNVIVKEMILKNNLNDFSYKERLRLGMILKDSNY